MRFVFLVSVFLFSCISLFAQEKTKILLKSASILNYNKEINPDVQKLSGNVVFQHDNTYMYCDSAFLYVNKNSLDAYGNVHIKASDTTNLFGDKLHYEGDTKIAEIENNVELIDNQIVLRTDKLTYDMSRNYAFYLTGGTIEDPNNKLVSDKGYYFGERKEFFFSDNVLVKGNNFDMISDSLMYNTASELVRFYGDSKIINQGTTILCDSGWYDTKKDVSKLYGNARMYNKSSVLSGDTLFYEGVTGKGEAYRNISFRDTSENIEVVGNYGLFCEKDSSVLACDSAIFMTWENNDTLYLHGDTLYSYKDSISAREIRVFHHVRFYRSDLQGVCDSLFYSEKDSLMRMYVVPILWADSNQLCAEYIHFKVDRNELKSLFMDKKAFIVSQLDENNFQQIKGNLINGTFKDNELEKLDVLGDAENMYFIEDENSKTGINNSKCERIVIFFKNNDVDYLNMINSPEGSIYPYKDLPIEKRKLNGFSWHIKLRPMDKDDIF